MPCPFLLEDEKDCRCKAIITKTIQGFGGKESVYQLLSASEAKQCANDTLYPRCPTYRKEKRREGTHG